MTIGELIAVIGADTSQLRAGTNEARRLLGGVGDSAKHASSGFRELDAVTARVKGALVGIGAITIGRSLIQMADTATLLAARIRLVTESEEEFADVSQKVFDIAQRTRTGLEGTVTIYTRLARSTQELGTSQSTLLRVTETINKALIVSGASAAEATNSLIQLSQGLASGALRGDELRSVLEQMPAVARIIAQEFGVSVGQLRQLGAEGALTSDRIVSALLKASAEIDKSFGQIPKTVGQAFVQLQNEVLRSVGSLNEGTGAARALAGALGLVADQLKVIAVVGGTIVVAKGLQALLGISSRLFPSLARTVTSMDALRGTLLTVQLGTTGVTNQLRILLAQLASLGLAKLTALTGLALLLNEAKNKTLEFATGLDRSRQAADQAAARYETIGRALHDVNQAGGAVNVLLPTLQDKLNAKLAEASFVARAGGDLTKINEEIRKLRQQLAENPFDAFSDPSIGADIEKIRRSIGNVRKTVETELASGEGLSIEARLEIERAEQDLAAFKKRIDETKDPELQLQLKVRHDLLEEELKRAKDAGQARLDQLGGLEFAIRINAGKGDKSLSDLASDVRSAIDNLRQEFEASGGELTLDVRVATKEAEEALERYRAFVDERVTDKEQRIRLQAEVEQFQEQLTGALSQAQDTADQNPVAVAVKVADSEIDHEIARLKQRLGEANVQQAVDLQFRIDELEAEKRRLKPIGLQVEANVAELERERDRLQSIIDNAPLEQALVIQARIDQYNRDIARIQDTQVTVAANVKANEAQVTGEITRLRGLLEAAPTADIAVGIQARIDKFEKQLAQERSKQESEPVKVAVEADTEPFRSELDKLRDEIAKARLEKIANDPGTTGRGPFGVGVDPSSLEAAIASAQTTGDAEALLGVIGEIAGALVGLRKEATAAGRDVVGSFSFAPFLNKNVAELERLAAAASAALRSIQGLQGGLSGLDEPVDVEFRGTGSPTKPLSEYLAYARKGIEGVTRNLQAGPVVFQMRRDFAEARNLSVGPSEFVGGGFDRGPRAGSIDDDPAMQRNNQFLDRIAAATEAGAQASAATASRIMGEQFISTVTTEQRRQMQRGGDRNNRHGLRRR